MVDPFIMNTHYTKFDNMLIKNTNAKCVHKVLIYKSIAELMEPTLNCLQNKT